MFCSVEEPILATSPPPKNSMELRAKVARNGDGEDSEQSASDAE